VCSSDLLDERDRARDGRRCGGLRCRSRRFAALTLGPASNGRPHGRRSETRRAGALLSESASRTRGLSRLLRPNRLRWQRPRAARRGRTQGREGRARRCRSRGDAAGAARSGQVPCRRRQRSARRQRRPLRFLGPQPRRRGPSGHRRHGGSARSGGFFNSQTDARRHDAAGRVGRLRRRSRCRRACRRCSSHRRFFNRRVRRRRRLGCQADLVRRFADGCLGRRSSHYRFLDDGRRGRRFFDRLFNRRGGRRRFHRLDQSRRRQRRSGGLRRLRLLESRRGLFAFDRRALGEHVAAG